jgi:hypothetical protein
MYIHPMLQKRCGEFVQGLITGGALASEDKGAFLGLCSRHKVILQIGLLLCLLVYLSSLFVCVYILFLSVFFFNGIIIYVQIYFQDMNPVQDTPENFWELSFNDSLEGRAGK